MPQLSTDPPNKGDDSTNSNTLIYGPIGCSVRLWEGSANQSDGVLGIANGIVNSRVGVVYSSDRQMRKLHQLPTALRFNWIDVGSGHISI